MIIIKSTALILYDCIILLDTINHALYEFVINADCYFMKTVVLLAGGLVLRYYCGLLAVCLAVN